jgi:hypothetical protein
VARQASREGPAVGSRHERESPEALLRDSLPRDLSNLKTKPFSGSTLRDERLAQRAKPPRGNAKAAQRQRSGGKAKLVFAHVDSRSVVQLDDGNLGEFEKRV